MTKFKPLTKSELIIWRCETREQLKEDFPTHDDETIERYLNAIENRARRLVKRDGGKFTDFE